MIVKHGCITPMFNIHVDTDIEMKHFTILKKRTISEIIELGFTIKESDFSNFLLEQWIKWPLLLCKTRDPLSNEQMYNLPRQFDNFYDILTLFKNNIHSPLVMGPAFCTTHIDNQSTLLTLHGFITPEYIKTTINLSQNNMADFDKAYEQLEPIIFQHNNNKILNRVFYAVSLLNKARKSPKFYDKFIFLAIALETLISNQQTELRYHISQRTAFLVGETDDQCYDIFSKIKNIYKLRSYIMHGNIKNNNNIEYDKLWFLQEVIRVLILKMISLSNHYTNPDELLEIIDNGVIKRNLKNTIMSQSNDLFLVCSKFVSPSSYD